MLAHHSISVWVSWTLNLIRFFLFSQFFLNVLNLTEMKVISLIEAHHFVKKDLPP